MARLIKGVNDLATTHPELVKEWHPTKNGDLKPTDIYSGSGTKVWWLLPYDVPLDYPVEFLRGKHFDFEWEATVKVRYDGHGCPFISIPPKATWKGFNDLATTHPELAKEWHPTKNGDLKPTDVIAGSGKKVWWFLPYDTEDGRHFDFEWEASLLSRSRGTGCPFISNQSLWKGFNDLATTHPELAKEWHPIKNGDLKPTDVIAGSHQKVWWLLPYDVPLDYPVEFLRGKHFDFEWEASLYSRSEGNGCPFITKPQKAVWKGFNDLATLAPSLLSEWHPFKNDKITPDSILAKSHQKVWWFLPYDTEDGRHFDFEWESEVKSRYYGHGCPFLPTCTSPLVWKGFNDLATTHPELAKEWHPTKNGDLKPTDVIAGSNQKVWWQCAKGHEWFTTVIDRSQGNGCPICSESHLEKMTRCILDKYNYNYSEQVKFDDLFGTGNRKLSYDFAIYEDNKLYALIECQGIQHYEQIEFFGGKRQYHNQLKHDRLKQEFCERNHILLIEIPYSYDKEDIDALFRPD